MAAHSAAEHYDQSRDRSIFARGERVDRMLNSFMRALDSFVERILIPFIIVAGIIIAAQAASALLSGRLP